jgi:hypothetical protein
MVVIDTRVIIICFAIRITSCNLNAKRSRIPLLMQRMNRRISLQNFCEFASLVDILTPVLNILFCNAGPKPGHGRVYFGMQRSDADIHTREGDRNGGMCRNFNRACLIPKSPGLLLELLIQNGWNRSGSARVLLCSHTVSFHPRNHISKFY